MRFLTAGESHGKGLSILIDDFPAGVPFRVDFVNRELGRRQQGYGRGGRMIIETDTVDVLSGVRFETTTGAPISLFIENRDFKNWTEVMASEGAATEAASQRKFTRPRPGHADLAGFYKFGLTDLRDVLERASARETAARVAAGAVAKLLLEQLGLKIFSHVTVLGGVAVPVSDYPERMEDLMLRAEENDLRCGGSDETMAQMRKKVDEALAEGVTLGGEIEIIALHVPPGLGSYVQWDRKLDGQLAQAVMSIQAVKSVSIGAGDIAGQVHGGEFHDEIVTGSETGTVYRPTNRAGGLEGGVTNGMPLVVKAVMKPISTMRKALRSLNLETGEEEVAHFERSDVTAVPACGVVCEAMIAIVLARAVLDKYGHDNLRDILEAHRHYLSTLNPIPQESI